MKVNGNTIKPGNVIEHKNGLWVATKTSHVKPGKGGAFAQIELRNLKDGTKLNERFRSSESVEKVILEDNVWIGDGSIVSKGVTIGKNSIVGARSVVIKDVPENVIDAGNPATVVKELDENEKMISRADMFSSPEELDALYLKIDRISLKENSFLGWVKSKFLPGKKN